MLIREDLVEKLCEKGYTKKDSATVLDDVFAVITESLVCGEDVMIHGFGKFEVRDYAERMCVDCRSQEKIVVPAYRAPRFVAGKTLRRSVKEGVVRG